MPRLQYFRSSNSRCGVHKAACKYTAQVPNARNGCFPLCNMDWWLFTDPFVKPFPSSDTESSRPLSRRAKEIVTAVRAYRTALEIRLLLTCETRPHQGITAKQVYHFVKSILFRFSHIRFLRCHTKKMPLSAKSINLYSGCASSMRLRLLILLT